MSPSPRLLTPLLIALLLLPGVAAVAQDAPEGSVRAQERQDDDDDDSPIHLRLRLAVPFLSAELINNGHGTQSLLGGAIGLDLFSFLTLEAGATWLETEPNTGFDAYGRVGVMWTPYDMRGDDGAGWQHVVPVALGYRFLRDADAIEDTEGSTDVHLLTASTGWQSTYFWSRHLGLEIRAFPTLSIALDETTEGSWGMEVPVQGFAPVPRIIGNENDMVWGFDFELSLGVVF